VERADLPALGAVHPDLRGETLTANHMIAAALLQNIALRAGHDRQAVAVKTNLQLTRKR
jgi:hypothetical protein